MDHYKAHGRKRISCWGRPQNDDRQRANQATRAQQRRDDKAEVVDATLDVPWQETSRETLHDGSDPVHLSFAIRVF